MKHTHMDRPQDREAALFELALEKVPGERGAFLDAVCAGDPALRSRLEELLAAHEQPETVLAGLTAAQRHTLKIEVPEPPDKAVGQRIGRYKLLQRIGEGGCGAVYMAEQEEPVRRRVALKVIKLGMDTRSVIARFEAERQALALMDHPNIAKVLDAGATETGRPYFVMELVKGIKITDYCDRNNLPTRERLDLFIQVCHAIQHAHQKGIIHRDIKPSNVLVTLHDGVPVPKVIDFGIAKATEQRLTDKTLFTAYEQFIGTPAYTSPEQAEMSGLDIDTRSDIYGLGVLLYELLTGTTPFDPKQLLAAGLDEMRRTIREKEPARPSTRLSTMLAGELTARAEHRQAEAPRLIHLVRGDLDWIVMKCLEKDRTHRYETANALAMDLKRHLKHEPVLARPPSASYRLQKAWRRNKLLFGAVAAVVLALALGFSVSALQAVRARRAEREQFRARQQATANEQRAVQAQADAERARDDAESQAYASDITLAQRALANLDVGQALSLLDRHRPKPRRTDRRGWEWRYLWQQSRSDTLSAPLCLSNRFQDLSVSADGKWLAARFVGPSNGVSVIDVSDPSKMRLVESFGTGDTEVPAYFLRRYPLLAFLKPRSDPSPQNNEWLLQLWDPRTRRVSVQAALAGPFPLPICSGDGERLLTVATRAKAGSRVKLWRLPNLEPLPVDPGVEKVLDGGAIQYLSFTPDFSHAAILADGHGQTQSLRVVDWFTGRTCWSNEVERAKSLEFSPDGRLLFLGTGPGEIPKIRVWDSRSGQEMTGLDGHREWIGALVFWPDGKTMASASADRTIRLWDLTDPARPKAIGGPLKGHTSEVWGLALLPDQRTLVSVGKDGTFLTWDSQKARADKTHLVLRPETRVSSWTFAADSKSILTLEDNGRVTRWNGPNVERPDVLVHLRNATRKLVVSGDFRWLATGATNGLVDLWDLNKRARVREFEAGAGSVVPQVFRERGRRLITLSGSGVAKEWDLNTFRETAAWKDLDGYRQLSPDERWYFAANFTDGRLLSRDLVTEAQIVQTNLNLKTGNATDMAVSPDGTLLAVSSEFGFVKLLDGQSLREVDRLQGFLIQAVFSVGFSPDGKRLATASAGREPIKLWDVHLRRQFLSLEAAGQGLFANVQFSPDGNIIGAICLDGTLHLWRAPSWEEIGAAERAP